MTEQTAPPTMSPEFAQTLCGVLASQRDEAASRGAEYLARAIVAEKAVEELRPMLATLKARIDELEAPTATVDAPPGAA